jgi:hypothetical protein
MPLQEDLAVYTSLLRHAALGINAASTVSLELMMHDKPIINLGFDPPGSALPHHLRWRRHLEFDHYRPVASSGAVMVAMSPSELAPLLDSALRDPGRQTAERRAFLEQMFHGMLDGGAGGRVAERLVAFASSRAAA